MIFPDGEGLVNLERLAEKIRGAGGEELVDGHGLELTVAGLESPLRMTTGIAAVAGVAASWRRSLLAPRCSVSTSPRPCQPVSPDTAEPVAWQGFRVGGDADEPAGVAQLGRASAL
jgi:hypothetical protein